LRFWCGAGLAFQRHLGQGAWFVKTDYKAPNGRILKAMRGYAERAERCAEAGCDRGCDRGRALYVNRCDVKTETTVYSLDGKATGKVEYEGIGTSSEFGRTTDR